MRSHDRTWSNRGAADPILSMLGGDILRQGNYPGFGYAVGYACEVSEHSTTRSGVDDTPATVADHQRNGVAAAQHVPSCVDLKRLSPDVHRRGGDIGVLRLSLLIRKRGIVEQDVEATAEMGCAGVYAGSHRGLVADIHADRECPDAQLFGQVLRSEEHTSELQSLMRISYAVFCL